MERPWTRDMLSKYGVSLGSFLGIEPYVLPGSGNQNPALEHLTQLIQQNKINFNNPSSVSKASTILKSQRVVVTDV